MSLKIPSGRRILNVAGIAVAEVSGSDPLFAAQDISKCSLSSRAFMHVSIAFQIN